MDEAMATFLRKYLNSMNESSLVSFKYELGDLFDEQGRLGEEAFLYILQGQRTSTSRMLCIDRYLTRFKLSEKKYVQDYKSDVTALQHDKTAKGLFAKKKYNEALRSYTQAVMTAKGEEMLAVAYYNRSAALLKLELYEDCLIDIERALSIPDCPDYARRHLVPRREKATETLRKSERMPNFHEEVPPFPDDQRNPTIPCAARSVNIEECRTGQKVVATETIQIGDIIAVEEPLVSIIDESGYLYHCHECFKLCYNPIPCKNCTQALYCNEDCRDQAHLTHHQYECHILLSLRKLLGKRINLAMAVKLLLQSGEELSDDVSHLIQTVRDEEFQEQIHLEMIAAIMYHLVKTYTIKFNDENGDALDMTFQNNIVALLQVCVLQTGGVRELCPLDDESGEVIGHETMAMAIYPFYAKLSHSCAPNAYPHHYGMKRVVRAIRTIERGKQVLVSFGPHYGRDLKYHRATRLQKYYHFNCACRACTDNWVQMDRLPPPVRTPGEAEFMSRMKRAPDVELANRTVPEKISKMQQVERYEPSLALTFQTKLLLHCYDVLGNKRVIH